MRIGKMNIPDPLLQAQKDGLLVVFAGAGVSIPPPSRLPDFDDLAQRVAAGSFQRDGGEPVDRFLGRLADQGVKVHEKVCSILSDPASAPNTLHSSILQLFGEPTKVRLVTTNFDLHFTSAAKSLEGMGQLEIHSAPALPVGNSFSGIVYLHGSIDKPPDRLVLTDSDFGRAYLTEGWARGFLQRLFAKYVVMFVGYSHSDPVMNYLARGLPPGTKDSRRFASTEEGDNDRWRYLGITPITYPLTQDENPHSALGYSLIRWVDLSRAGALEQEQKIKNIAARPVPIDLEELDYIENALRDASTTRFFTRYAKSTDWLRWVESRGFLKRLFGTGQVTDEVNVELASWFAAEFVVEHPEDALAVVRRGGQILSPLLWLAIAQHFHARKARPSAKVLGKWIPLLISSRPANTRPDFLEYMFHASTFPDGEATCLLLFEHLTRPTIGLKEDFWGVVSGESEQENVEFELSTEGSYFWLHETWNKRLWPAINDIADKLMMIVASNLQQAYLLLRATGKVDAMGDPLSRTRGMIEGREQGSPENGLGVLIDAACELLKWNIANQSSRADFWIDTWASSGCQLLRRLATFGVAENTHWSPDMKIEWILKNDLLYTYGYKHEVFSVLQNAYPGASEKSRTRILDRATEGPQGDIKDRKRDYEIFNLLHWLVKVAPDCPHANSRLNEITHKHPEFGPRERPDMDSWIGPVRLGLESPTGYQELLSKPPAEQIDFLITFEGKHPLGPSREGLVENVRVAAAHNYEWGIALRHSLKQRKSLEPDLWQALVGGWRQSDLNSNQWQETLQFLFKNDDVLSLVVYDTSRLLEDGINKTSSQIPNDCLDLALQLSEKLWSNCTRSDDGKQEKAKDWLSVAINRPAGNILMFFLKLLSRLRKESGGEWQGLRPEYSRFLESVLSGLSYAAELGRIVLASHVHFLFALDEKWAIANVVPLFDWKADSKRALQAWHGFLGWGRWNDGLLPHLMPYYEMTISLLQSELAEYEARFCEHLAGIACFSSVDPIKSGWLNHFLREVGLEGRVMWASSVTMMLREMKPQGSLTIWNNWIQVYWQNRIEGLPLPLDPAEVGQMVSWSIHLQLAFPAVVTKICESPLPKFEHSFVYHELSKAEVIRSQPTSVAKLVLHLIRHESTPFYDTDSVVDIVREVANSDVDRDDILQICDQLARLGYPGAKRLRESIEDTRDENGPEDTAQ